MIVYWVLFSITALLAMIGRKRSLSLVTGRYAISLDSFLIAWVFFLIILIGLRYEVGGDWLTYKIKFDLFQGKTFNEIFKGTLGDDPLYNLAQWLSYKLGWGIYGVNIICATSFSYGLGVFCKNLPRPWLGLTVAIPYLVIVVSMGYTRQAFALGIAMIGLVALSHQKMRKFIFYIILAAMAHKSAILLLPIAGLAASKNRLLILMWFTILAIAGYFIFLADSIEFFMYGYIELDYQSDGAFIRLAMNAMPAILMIIFYKKFEFPPGQKRLWLWFSLISLALMGGYFIFPSSTALDRVALYMLPLQIVVFSYFPDIFSKDKVTIAFLKMGVIAYYAVVQFVWLNYATHSYLWVPYKNLILL
jgi:hypothetical protein